jgi:hypothetical protein
VITRAIDLAKLTPKDVAFRLGYHDQSALSRWMSGAEAVRFGKLWSLKELRPWLVMALAEEADGVRVQTVVTVERRYL